MSGTSQGRAVRNYRKRLGERGMARFEVMGLDTDRELIRSLAKRLALKDLDADRIRATIGKSIADASSRRGGILEALRRSPLVGADLDLTRSGEDGRKVEL